MTSPEELDLLERKAQTFAFEVTKTLRGVLGATCPDFVVESSPMRIDGQLALSLIVDFDCSWDHRGTYLMVQRASFRVEPVGKGQPLFRYEFVSDMKTPHLPSAHLHVHAHRDEFLYAMIRGQRGRPKDRAKAVTGESGRAVPRLSDVHFPLGGARMRPCLEDILEMLHAEFGVDIERNAQMVLDEGRARWRRRQLGAAVRDAPEQAVRVLREMGYSIEDHPAGPQPDRMDKLTGM